MTPETAGVWLGVIIAGAAVLAILGRLARRLWRTMVLSVHAFETIQKELKPNGGGSTYDLVRKLKAQADEHEARLSRIDLTTTEAATIAGLATSRAERAVELAHEAVAEAKAARHALVESDARCVLEIARTQGAVEGLERTLALTVITSKSATRAPRKQAS